MELHSLTQTATRGRRRLGQGHGSGRVKTAGRGTKGQLARYRVALSFEGGALPLIKRLPFRRGKGRNKVFKRQPIGINLKTLNMLPANTTVDLETLIKHTMVDKADGMNLGVKILGDGEITIPLTIALPITKQAAAKIEKAGGTVSQ